MLQRKRANDVRIGRTAAYRSQRFAIAIPVKLPLTSLLLCAYAVVGIFPAYGAPKKVTLDDLKKLDITCLVPAWLPEGYHLKKVGIQHENADGNEEAKGKFPAYSLEYSNGKKGKFTVECAHTGIGDRNLDQDERAEESQFDTKHFGPVYIIYFPPEKSGVKHRIVANWIEDEDMKAEKAKDENAPRIKGRYHGVSGFGMTVGEFEKIVQSLHPVREKSADSKPAK